MRLLCVVTIKSLICWNFGLRYFYLYETFLPLARHHIFLAFSFHLARSLISLFLVISVTYIPWSLLYISARWGIASPQCVHHEYTVAFLYHLLRPVLRDVYITCVYSVLLLRPFSTFITLQAILL